MHPRFYALALQTTIEPVTEETMTRAEAMAIVRRNLDAALSLAWKGVGNGLGDVKLVTFPEMFLTLAPAGWRTRPSGEWLDLACVEVPGPELEPLFQFARDAGLYVGANVYEYDPLWPGRYFNCSFLVDPRGDVILKYRRLHSNITPSPHDFLDEYVAALGWDALFPVADTEIGRIGMFPCMEITKPEVARMMALKGAEILLHPTGDSPDFAGWTACKQARALENNVYLISTNTGGWITKRGQLETSNGGGTKIIDYYGNIINESGPAGESMKCRALIDIEQLRAHRHSANSFNVIAQLRTELYTEYKRTITPPNRFKDPLKDRRELTKLYGEVMERMTAEGLFPRPMYSGDEVPVRRG
jgi:predicted amidohydrolase